MSNIELKNCPFCGGKAKMFNDKEGVSFETLKLAPETIIYIMCDSCPALTSGRTIQEAAANWNARHECKSNKDDMWAYVCGCRD